MEKKAENIPAQEQEQWNKKICTHIDGIKIAYNRELHIGEKRGAKSEVMHVHTLAAKAGVANLGIVIRLAGK